MKHMRFWITISLLVLLFSCKKAETLKEAYEDHFLIGAAVTTGAYTSIPVWKMYNEDVLKNFNCFVTENALKPEAIANRNPERYSFAPVDGLIEYTKKNDITLRGHVLVWHSQSPSFLANSNMSEEEAIESLHSHINTTMEHFGDDIPIWDVVNEAISDEPGKVYRDSSLWHKAFNGDHYIQEAFRTARKSQPNAQLYYNDYNVWVPEKRDKIVQMIKEQELIENGMTGIGLQGHWNLEMPTVDMIQETIDVFTELGLRVSITELDIDCYNSDPSASEREYDKELEKQLAKRYDEIFEVFRENSDSIDAVVLWGVADDHSWLHKFCTRPIAYRTNYPLLFDWAAKPKKAFYEVLWF